MSREELARLIERWTPEEDIYLFNTGRARQAYLSLGCRYLPEEGLHRFLIWAPSARAVSVVGDFNGWETEAHPMTALPETGFFIAFIPGLQDGSLYKYAITQAGGETTLKADPWACHAETGPGTASKVWDITGYQWGDGPWLEKRALLSPWRQPMNIYEVHLGSWRLGEGEVYPNYARIAPELAAYCRDMGYTHVELLPLTEYPFGGSWGYQTSGYYAPTSRYGTPQDFMALVDTLHQAGIGVILDWAPAHFPKDAHGLARFDGTCLFEHPDPRRREHPQWGTLVFDYGRPQVKSFLISSARLFCDHYHVDGLRVDAVSSMLYLNYGREDGDHPLNREGGLIDLEARDFIRELNSSLLTDCPACFTVAEESTAYPGVTLPPHEGGLGFTFKWDMGFMHDTLDYLALDPLFRPGSHHKLTFSLMYAFSENFILAYSHDEVVHGKKSLLDKMYGDYGQKFATLKTLFGYQLGHPGKKLIFMGSEFGQFIEWDYEKQLDWLLLDYPAHRQLQEWCRAINHFYLDQPALWRADHSWQGFSWLNVDDADRSSLAFMRRGEEGDEPILLAVNFSAAAWEDFRVSLPGPGRVVPALSSDEVRFGGAGGGDLAPLIAEERPFREGPYSAGLRLPPLSACFYRFVPEEEKEYKPRTKTL